MATPARPSVISPFSSSESSWPGKPSMNRSSTSCDFGCVGGNCSTPGVLADAMIRDSRPKGSLDLDDVLHFAKRFDGAEKRIPRLHRAWDDSEELRPTCELKLALLRESIWPEARWTSGRSIFSIRVRLR